MKRHTILILAIFIVGAMLLGTALVARASPSRTDFTITEYVCGIGWDKDWTSGNVWHIRSYEHVNVDESVVPEVNGLNTTFADADINLENGVMNIHGTFSIQPDAYDGTWEGTWVFNGTPGGGEFARGVGRGTGMFAGKHIFLKVYDIPPDDWPEDSATKCDGIGGFEAVELVEGYILDP